jgi:hypothetical protein
MASASANGVPPVSRRDYTRVWMAVIPAGDKSSLIGRSTSHSAWRAVLCALHGLVSSLRGARRRSSAARPELSFSISDDDYITTPTDPISVGDMCTLRRGIEIPTRIP